MRRLPVLRIFIVLVFCILFPSSVFANYPSLLHDNPEERLIIKYRNVFSNEERAKFHRSFSLENIGRIDRLNADIVRVARMTDDVLVRIRRDPRVEYIERDHLAHVQEMSNDPALTGNLQWGINKIQATGNGISAFNYTKGLNTVNIAILDTGIDQNHEDLKNKIVKNNNCTSSSTADDLYGHGTHVAGIAGASTNNGIGVAGVGYNTMLMNIKVLGDDGSGYYSWIANCLYWAADNGANVINMSLGGSSSSQTLEDAINYAWSKGVVLVAAAGNDGKNTYLYPAFYSKVIAVAATDQYDKKATFSNYGSWVDVAAPGVSIYSTLPNHGNAFNKFNYGYLSGTSMASPHVAGLAGLLFGISGINNINAREYIEKGADKISGTGIYWNSGRINALTSVNLALASVPVPANSPTPTLTPTPVKPTYTPTPTPKSFWCRINPRYCR